MAIRRSRLNKQALEFSRRRRATRGVTVKSYQRFDDEDILKNRIRMKNPIVNRRFLKKKYKTTTDRIMFHNFIENSYNKNLIHTHSIIRIPRFLLERVKEVFKYLKHIVVNKFYFSIRITKRLNRATRYMTKHYHENNDRYFVN